MDRAASIKGLHGWRVARTTTFAAAFLLAGAMSFELSPQDPTPASTRSEQVTVSFRDTPLLDVVRVFSEASGRSIVVGTDIGGVQVTGEIRDRPWDVALRAILDAHGLQARVQREAGIIVIGRPTPEAEAPMTVTQVLRIQYARADEIASAIVPHLTERGRVSVLTSLNAVLVTDIPEMLDEMSRLIGN